MGGFSRTNPTARCCSCQGGAAVRMHAGTESQRGATARALLLWDKAPRTCAAVCSMLPFSTWAWHGRNSGDEALLITPSVMRGVPQDASENATMFHKKGNVAFGLELAGFCHGGAGTEDASEIAWFYGDATQACYWVSEKGPPHSEGPYHRQAATLNIFAHIEEEEGFYAQSNRMGRYGQQRVTLTGSAEQENCRGYM